MNIYGARVDFDQPHRFIGEATSSMNIRGFTDKYKVLELTWYVRKI
jgi:hypothetical protein